VKYEGLKIIKTMDGRKLRKACVRLSLSTYTSIEYFMKLDIFDLSEAAEEVKGGMKSNGQK